MKGHEGHRIIEVEPDGELHDGLQFCSDCGTIEARVIAGGKIVVDVLQLTRQLAETIGGVGRKLEEGAAAFDRMREALSNPLIRELFPKTAAALDEEIASRTTAAAALEQIAAQRAERTVERDPPEFVRASGDSICGTCSMTYYTHPLTHEPELNGPNGDPFLHRLCDGTLVKL